MNALTGRLGLRHPHVSAYTNFVAYKRSSPPPIMRCRKSSMKHGSKKRFIMYMDTDSILLDKKSGGFIWNITDRITGLSFPLKFRKEGRVQSITHRTFQDVLAERVFPGLERP